MAAHSLSVPEKKRLTEGPKPGGELISLLPDFPLLNRGGAQSSPVLQSYPSWVCSHFKT